MSIFSSLSSQYPTWESFKTFLTSEAGGFLRIEDHSTQQNPFALIRYVKGTSNLSIPHVRAMRSVVWDTIKNVPVSIAPQKSVDGECIPTDDDDNNIESVDDYLFEPFVDGVMLCGFYDQYNKEWRFHTRSTIDAKCRFLSQTKSFSELFKEAVEANTTWENFIAELNPEIQYSWVIQHPDNRIVVEVPKPNLVCVQKQRYTAEGEIVKAIEPTMFDVKPLAIKEWSDIPTLLRNDTKRLKHNFQGYVIKQKQGDKRWKLRHKQYNEVRKMRGNSARRDYLWLSLWRTNTLTKYLTIYPEERDAANAVITKWKNITGTVFHMYTDVFKFHSMKKNDIPPRYRPFIFELHNKYINELKPQGKSINWTTVIEFMNSRDTAQALYAINWDIRTTKKNTIPMEGQTNVADEVLPSEIVAEPTPTSDNVNEE